MSFCFFSARNYRFLYSLEHLSSTPFFNLSFNISITLLTKAFRYVNLLLYYTLYSTILKVIGYIISLYITLYSIQLKARAFSLFINILINISISFSNISSLISNFLILSGVSLDPFRILYILSNKESQNFLTQGYLVSLSFNYLN